jgi:O-antigen ligase
MFVLVLLYIITFYLQPGSRIPALGVIRFELVLGSILLFMLLLKNGGKFFSLTKMNKAILFFFIAVCLSFFGAVYTRTASDAFEILVRLLKFFSVYIMIVGTVDTTKKLKIFMLVYLGAICFFYMEPFLLSLQGKNLEYEGGVTHLYGVGQFGHYNSLGGITGSNLAFFVSLFPYYGFLIKTAFIAFGAIGMKVIMLTGSRTAYVGTIVLGVLTVIFSRNKARNIILVVLLAIVIFAVMPEEYRARFDTIGDTGAVISGEQQEGSMYTRWIIIKDAWKVFLRYPIVGCGLDNFWRIRGIMFNRWQQEHNLYMQVLTNMGIIGFISFSYLIFMILKYLAITRKKLRKMKMERSYLMGMVNALNAFLIMRLVVGMFGHDLYDNYWWLIAGLTVVVYEIVDSRYTIVSNGTG